MATLRDEYWTPENINLLIDKRISRDAIFKQTNSDRLAWLQVTVDMKKEGGSKALNRINVRKQWFKVCELYKKSSENVEDIKNEVRNSLYYEKLKQFFEKNIPNSVKTKCINQEFRKKMTARILKMTSYADRWSVDRTNALIDARIARHSMFKGRGHAAVAWKVITQDVCSFKEAETGIVTAQQVKKKWENLLTKYKAMNHTQIFDTKWPHFNKMHYFYTQVHNSKEKTGDEVSMSEDQNCSLILADRWPATRTKLLIERRLARSSMFGRGLSAKGWQTVVEDLIKHGAPPDLTMTSVRKKWENLLTRYKILKDSKDKQTKWPYFAQMERYHKEKKSRKYKKDLFNDDQIDVMELLSEPVEIEEISENELSSTITEKLSKCRLCQQSEGDYSLIDDKELCDRIIECTSINVYESTEIMPTSVCGICKTTIEKFYEFLSHCHNMDKELRATAEQIVIKTENRAEDTEQVNQTKNKILHNSYECPECPASFTSGEVFRTHVKSHKPSIKYHCEICSVGFSKQSALYAHIKQHFEMTKVETLEMEEVKYLFDKDNVDNSDINNIGTAEDCDTGEENIDIVVTDHYKCEFCLKTFFDENTFKDHLDTHSKIEHHCPRENCNKKFSTLNSLRHHEMRHLGLNSFLCTICGKGFVTSNALKMHEKIHAEVKEHICEICSRGFSVYSNLRAHQKKHHEGHRFYCSQCPKEFLTKSSLQRHELVHTGVKEFVCDTCSSAFFTIKELRKHKRYHDGVRMYHCSECFKTFFEKHHLTIHIRSHTGEKPFACTIAGCTKSFREKQKLQRHEKTPHRILQ